MRDSDDPVIVGNVRQITAGEIATLGRVDHVVVCSSTHSPTQPVPEPYRRTFVDFFKRPPAVVPVRVKCKYQRKLLGLDL